MDSDGDRICRLVVKQDSDRYFAPVAHERLGQWAQVDHICSLVIPQRTEASYWNADVIERGCCLSSSAESRAIEREKNLVIRRTEIDENGFALP